MPPWQPLPHQVPPTGDWYGWLLLGGRMSGKTDACARYMDEHVKGPPCIKGPAPHWMGIIAPTLGDAATSCYYGPSGLRAHNPETKLITTHGGTVVRWPNGSEAKLFGALNPEDVERLRSGGNRCLQWLEELAAWRHLDDCWDHMRFGLRQGPRPHWIGSTTPKPRKLIKTLAANGVRNVVITHATTADNPYIVSSVREMLIERYGGTALGAQELLGRIVEEDENALWKREPLERGRLEEIPLPMLRVTIGVDPSGGSGEQGIVAVGKALLERGKPPHGYVLADRTCRLDPNGWGRRAVQAAVDLEADDIAVETNFGGDMALSTIHNALDHMGLVIPVKKLTASRGKRPRAEPVSVLAPQNRWHHVGVFEELEDQLCTWTPESPNSPDRLDGMVWAAWQTKLVSMLTTVQGGSYGGGMMSQHKVG